MHIEEDSKKEQSKSDIKFNIISVLWLLFGIFLFFIAINKTQSIGQKVDYIIGAGELMLFFGFISALLAKVRNEPREALTYTMLLLYGLGVSYILFAIFIMSFIDMS